MTTFGTSRTTSRQSSRLNRWTTPHLKSLHGRRVDQGTPGSGHQPPTELQLNQRWKQPPPSRVTSTMMGAVSFYRTSPTTTPANSVAPQLTDAWMALTSYRRSMARRTLSKTRKRTPGWIGTRVTVCGKRIQTSADLICLLPPGHDPTTIHSSIAVDEDSHQPIMVIQDDNTQELQWLSLNG